MPEPRGKKGTVRGLSADRAKALIKGAVRELEKRRVEWEEKAQGDSLAGDYTFSRHDLLTHFRAQEGVSPEQAQALVYAFWRAVAPRSLGYGQYTLPPLAEQLAEHRDWRFTSGRLQLADVVQLRRMLGDAKEKGVELAPGLDEFYTRSAAALRSLGITDKEASR